MFREIINDVAVLYVEDDNDVFSGFERFFTNRFKNVYFARNGQEGLEKFKEHKPEIVVTDIRMPRMDGIQMLEEMKKDGGKFCSIITSAFNETEYLHRAIELNVSKYVLKPIKKNQLEEALQELVEYTRLKRMKIEYTHNLEELVSQETKKRVEQEKLLLQQSKFIILGEMIGSIAHQLKQPLNIVSMSMDNIEEMIKDSERDDFMQVKTQIRRSVEYMSDTINVFRNFLKPQEARLSFELAGAFYDVFLLTAKMLKSSDIEWSIKVGDKLFVKVDEIKSLSSLLGRIAGDPNEFKQVIMNLIANSRDALKEKNGDAKIGIEITQESDVCKIEFCDNGTGIDSNIIEHLFEPYRTTKGEHGTGIGLYMCKQIIDKMGGTILARNGDVGASFLITIKRTI